MENFYVRTPSGKRDRLSHLSDETPVRSPRTPRMHELAAVTRVDMFRKIESACEAIEGVSQRLDELAKNTEKKLEAIMLKLGNMEEDYNQHHAATRTPDTKTPLELSTLVRHIHKNLGGQLQWKVREADNFRTPHNEEVTAAVIQAVKDVEPNWSFHQVRRACNRAYENYKSHERIERDGSKEGVKRRKLLTSRRDRLFRKRVKVAEKILNEEDLSFIKGANANLVSDEESDEEKTTYHYASPKWRSTRLTRLMLKCQKALDVNRKSGVEPRSTYMRHSAGFTTRNPPLVKSCYLAENSNMDS